MKMMKNIVSWLHITCFIKIKLMLCHLSINLRGKRELEILGILMNPNAGKPSANLTIVFLLNLQFVIQYHPHPSSFIFLCFGIGAK